MWLRATRSFFAVFCLVLAALAGSAPGRVSPAQVGTTQDTTPRADAQRDAGRNLLRPQAVIVAKGTIWRSIGASGAQPDLHPGTVLIPWQSAAWLGKDEAGSAAPVDRGPPWLVVRAGHSRAPPAMIGRSRTAA